MDPQDRLGGMGHCPWNVCSETEHLVGLLLDYTLALGKGTNGQLQEYMLR